MRRAGANSPDVPRYPHAPPDDVVEILHGLTIPDPYRWLEEANSARTQAWCAAQDALARRLLETIPGREALRVRLQELARIGWMSTPALRRGRAFYLRRAGDQEHAVLLVREPDGDERTLIDPSALRRPDRDPRLLDAIAGGASGSVRLVAGRR